MTITPSVKNLQSQVTVGIERVVACFEMRGQIVTPNDAGYFVTNCPVAHNHKADDSRPSLHFREIVNEDDQDDRTVFFNCWSGGCTPSEILQALELSEDDIFSKPNTRNTLRYFLQSYEAGKALTIDEFSREKLLPKEFLMMQLDIHEDVLTFHDRDGRAYKKKGLLFPYMMPDGVPHERAKLRVAMKKRMPKDNLFYWREGDDQAVFFGMQCLLQAKELGWMVWSEGESDTATGLYHGFPTLGISGATNAEKILAATLERVPDLLDGINTIYVTQEKTDQAGINFPYSVQLALKKVAGYTGQILRVPLRNLTGAKDPSELHIQLYQQAEKPVSEQALHEQYQAEFKRCLDQAKAMDYDTGQQQMESEPLDTTAIDSAIEAKNAKALFKEAPTFARMSMAEYGVYCHDITSIFGKSINMSKFEAAVREARKALTNSDGSTTKVADVYAIGELFAARYGQTWRYDVKAECWRRFDGTHWPAFANAQDEKLSLDIIFKDLLRECGFMVNTTNILNTVHRSAQAQAACKHHFKPVSDVVNFRNGTLHVTTMQLIEHCKDDDLLYCLPYDYDQAGQHPIITRWLLDTLHSELPDGSYAPDPHAVQIAMAHMGLALMGDTRMQYALFIKGAKGAGKSTFLDLMNLLCGVVSSPGEVRYAPHDIFSDELEGKRSRYEWHNERVVTVDELPVDGLSGEQTYKRMAAHGGVGIRGIGKNEQKDNQWKPKLLITCNEAPSFKDTTDAIKRRNVYITAPYAIPEKERDVRLIFKMADELGAFARTCILLAKRVLERGYYPQSAAMRAYANSVSADGNPLKLFVESQCRIGCNDQGEPFFVSSTTLYNTYKEWCFGSGYKWPLTIHKFSTELKDMGKGITAPKNAVKLRGSDRQCRVLYGIDLATSDELISIEEPQLENDPLLSSGIDSKVDALLTLVDGKLTDFLENRQPVSNGSTPALTQGQNSQVDTIDGFSEKYSKDFISSTHNGHDSNVRHLSSYTENRNAENPSSLSTTPTNQPVEPFQPLTDVQNKRQQTVNSPSISVNQSVNCHMHPDRPAVDSTKRCEQCFKQFYARMDEIAALAESMNWPTVRPGRLAINAGEEIWRVTLANVTSDVTLEAIYGELRMLQNNKSAKKQKRAEKK